MAYLGVIFFATMGGGGGQNYSQLRLSHGPLLGLRSWRPSKESASPKRGCLNVGAWNPQESSRKAPLSCNAAFSMLQCSFSFAAAQLLVQMTSALQKRQCCSAVPAAQHSENCSATSVFACGMLQGWGLEGSGLGLAERSAEAPARRSAEKVLRKVPVRNGVLRKVPKKALWAPRLCRGSIGGDRTWSTSFGTFLGTPFGPALSEALFRHFSWPGLLHFFRWPGGS